MLFASDAICYTMANAKDWSDFVLVFARIMRKGVKRGVAESQRDRRGDCEEMEQSLCCLQDASRKAV